MSTNSNLEIKVNELTNVIRNLSDKPSIQTADLNNILNGLIDRVEDVNLEGFDKLSGDIRESLIDALNSKYEDVNDRLSIFESFIANVEKTVENPKVEAEITRILNDIEALHSKMNSQEVQTESLIKSVESVKNTAGSGQITKLCDEIVSISKSYDGIVEVLNGNFQEFLRRVESLSSREEFQRLRYSLETLEGNQNVIVSAMNAVNDKQDEIRNVLKQSAGVQNNEKFEALQLTLSRMNEILIDTSSKADIEVLSDKISSLGMLFAEFRRNFDEANETDFRNVFQGQLNNIISRLESLKLDNNTNLSEDIIRLYTSIAEFKDGVHSAINTNMNDIVANMDVQFDKISNSMLNANMDTSDAMRNVSGEIQKLNSVVSENFSAKTTEIRQEIVQTAQECIATTVNAIKGELSLIANEISSLNNNDIFASLIGRIDGLKDGLDFDSLIVQMNQIKSALNLEPIQRELANLNQDETIKSISRKIDILMAHSKNMEILSRLDEFSNLINPDKLYAALDIINTKINTISDNSVNNSDEILQEISGKLNFIDTRITEKNDEKFEEIKENLELLGEIIKTFSLTPLQEQIEIIERNILSGGVDNIKETKSMLVEFQDGLISSLEGLKNIINQAKAENNSADYIQMFDEFESRFTEKIISLETLVEEGVQSGNTKFQTLLNDAITALKADIASGLSVVVEEITSNKAAILNENVKNLINELKVELSNFLKQETEIITSAATQKSETLNKELLTKIAQVIAARENSEARINFIKRVTESLGEIISQNAAVKQGLLDISNLTADVKTLADTINTALEESKNSSNDGLADMVKSLSETFGGLDNKIAEIFAPYGESLKNTSDLDIRITDTLSDKIDTVRDDIQALNENLNGHGASLTASIDENTAAVEQGLNSVNDGLNSINSNFAVCVDETNKNLEDKFNVLSAGSEQLQAQTADIKNAIEILNDTLDDINASFEDYKNIESRGIDTSKLENKIDELKNELADIKTALDKDFLDKFSNTIEQKLEDKTSSIEASLEESVSKLDLRSTELLGQSAEDYKNALNEKIDFAIEKLKAEYEIKLGDIQKTIDEKVYEIISRNNDVIKDELKIRGDSVLKDLSEDFKDKISKIEAVLIKNENEEEQAEAYTLADVESDIAKIRLGIEKSNKLSNFKEFATRLVELKNINLESAKISRVIGSDIMRFDSWLKNTTAKIELLSAKIDKSEKIKMEDLKSRIIQSEKNHAMPQKLEEAVMSIYKKYRLQETKIDDLLNKIDTLSQKQSETFDVKEFIDLFYDNTQKTQSLAARIDGIEDKMDLIQAKIDHIITSCIDE